MSAREAALLTLSAFERHGVWSEGYLNNAIRAAELDARDAALATRLCFGVLQNKLLLDFYLSRFSTTPPERMEGKVRNALRLGIYQIAFLEKIPDSAAVNESVALTRKHCKNPRAPGLVNAVLRSFLRSADRLPTVPDDDPIAYLSVRYSCPAWLVKGFYDTLGLEEAEALLRANNAPPPVTAQVNTLKITAAGLIDELTAAGVLAASHPYLPDCLILSGTGALERLSAFCEGKFYIQDAAARMAVMAAAPAQGARVLDACAAPGGKTFAAAIAMGDRGTVLSCDVHARKKRLTDEGAVRLGLTCVETAVADAKQYREAWKDSFDCVIADVPCSGLGVIRKKPEIRYRDPGPMEDLPRVQLDILRNVSRYVKPGGALLYSTCTLRRAENEDVVRAFLAEDAGFEAEDFTLPAGAAAGGMLTLWPHRGDTDGFFIARLRKAGAEPERVL